MQRWIGGQTVSEFINGFLLGHILIYTRPLADVQPEKYKPEQFARMAAHPQGPMRKVKADENEIFNGNSFLFFSMAFVLIVLQKTTVSSVHVKKSATSAHCLCTTVYNINSRGGTSVPRSCSRCPSKSRSSYSRRHHLRIFASASQVGAHSGSRPTPSLYPYYWSSHAI